MAERFPINLYFDVDDKRINLTVNFDKENNVITYTGGKHAFAELCQKFIIYAKMPDQFEDSAWSSENLNSEYWVEFVSDNTLERSK